MKSPRLFFAALALLALGSCTRLFQVKASIVDGALVFTSSDDERTYYPWCWHYFAVVDGGGRPAWEFEVPYGAFEGKDKCGPNFPIRYGQPPERAETMAAAQRLEIGRLYVIDGHSAGHLEGAFKIERIDGGLRVRNLDPSSAESLAVGDSYFEWRRAHDPQRISQTPTGSAEFEVQEPPRAIPKYSRAGPSGRDEFTWVLHPDAWSNFPSLSYQSLTGRTSFNLWCRYTEGPIYARVPSSGAKGAPLELSSGGEQLTAQLVGAGNPNRRDRVDAILDGDSPILRRFGQTGELTVETDHGKLDVSAVDGTERAVIKRFFRLCTEPRPAPSPLVEVSEN